MDIMKKLLKKAVDIGASDLHLTVGCPPIVRIHRSLKHIDDFQVLSPHDIREMVFELLTEQQKERFERERELDVSIHIYDISRFRVNVHMQRGYVEASFRIIPFDIKPMRDLHLPPIVETFARKKSGLILVTGPTGVGKTTTLSAMIDLINSEREALIVCIEDPIEYLHKHKKSVIKQREVGSDTLSFANALRFALRQDPDVIMVGEMRDLETIQTTITAAETGHLVLSTLHTLDAASTVDRLIDSFPPNQREQVMLQLAGCLQGVISQQLLPSIDGENLIPAVEIMVGTYPVRRFIRERKTEQLSSAIQTGAEFGMVSMKNSIKDLYQRGLIDLSTAQENLQDISDLV
jgi:twitching motility protein PilT